MPDLDDRRKYIKVNNVISAAFTAVLILDNMETVVFRINSTCTMKILTLLHLVKHLLYTHGINYTFYILNYHVILHV